VAASARCRRTMPSCTRRQTAIRSLRARTTISVLRGAPDRYPQLVGIADFGFFAIAVATIDRELSSANVGPRHAGPPAQPSLVAQTASHERPANCLARLPATNNGCRGGGVDGSVRYPTHIHRTPIGHGRTPTHSPSNSAVPAYMHSMFYVSYDRRLTLLAIDCLWKSSVVRASRATVITRNDRG
jgi:hypothetical protein